MNGEFTALTAYFQFKEKKSISDDKKLYTHLHFAILPIVQLKDRSDVM